MKKKLIVLAALLTLGMTGYAAEPAIDITDISSQSGSISVDVANNLGKDARITLKVIKKDDVPVETDKYYAVLQGRVTDGESIRFEFVIPDEKLSTDEVSVIRGSGTYEISAYSDDKIGDTETYLYADRSDVKAFFTELKNAADKVTDSSKAYEELESVLDKEEYRIVFASMGFDYEAFSKESETIRRGTLNSLYALGIDTLSEETIAEAFQNMYGLNVFNFGNKEEGLKYLNPTYNGAKPEEKYEKSALGIMTDVYVTIEDFEVAYATAYGLSVLRATNISEIEEQLDVFKNETGLCGASIDKIKGLSASKREKAYEYTILSLSKGDIETADELDSLLLDAYKSVSKSVSSSGGGGGSTGGSSNRIPPQSTAVSVAMGSGGTDKYEEATFIFSDLSAEHWAAESVDFLKKAGIINGTENGCFEPDRFITREEFAKMLVASCGIETKGRAAEFEDIINGAWYIEYIGAATENGIVYGIGDNKFGIGQNITRQDMAVMTARAIEKKSVELSKLRSYAAFSDEAQIADYASDSIKRLYESGIINGKGADEFDPLGNATRAEAAKIIYEAFKGGIG